MSLKKNPDKLFEFIKRFPTNSFSIIYKSKDIPAETLMEILKSFKCSLNDK